MDKVVIIGGPTASGKSALAYQLAQERRGMILNGDSLQVYAGLEILTDQPPFPIQQEIPHRLYGFLDPTQPYSVGLWLSHILEAIEETHQMDLCPIVVGGTGLYLKALQEGITPVPSVDPRIRQELEERESPQDVFFTELQKIDAPLAARIHPHDRQRTLRALEVFYGTGKPLSFWQTQKPQAFPYTFETILLLPSQEEHRIKIAERIEKMVEKHVLDEVTALLPLSLSPTAQKAIGLREFRAFLQGQSSLEKAKELTFFHTCQYAKRQRTWFRHQYPQKNHLTSYTSSIKEIDLLRKRLYYQSYHRGMREMDLILGGFAQQHLDGMSWQELLQFETLLAFPDQQLYGWIFEKASLSDDVPGTLIEMIIGYIYNK